VDDGESPGRLLIIGGAEDRCCGVGLLERFVELCGGDQARLVLVTTASDVPEEVLGDYERVFSKLDGFEVIGTGVATVVDAEAATVVHAAGECDPITLFGVRLHLLPAGGLFDFRSRTPVIGPAHNRY
jgi:cyanophycinase